MRYGDGSNSHSGMAMAAAWHSARVGPLTLVLLLFSGETIELPSALSLARPLVALWPLVECGDTGESDDDPTSIERGEPRGVGRIAAPLR